MVTTKDFKRWILRLEIDVTIGLISLLVTTIGGVAVVALDEENSNHLYDVCMYVCM